MYLRSDEAGCYHNNSLIAALPSIGERTGISVRRFDISEPQHGKDICDRILCPMKATMRTFCNEGHDILAANDMHMALKERQVKGTTATVIIIIIIIIIIITIKPLFKEGSTKWPTANKLVALIKYITIYNLINIVS